MEQNKDLALFHETDYVALAEKAIKDINQSVDRWGKKISPITTSKIRGLLSHISDIYNYVHTSDFEENTLKSRIQYLKVQFVYEAGRDDAVKNFIEKANIISYLDKINTRKENFVEFEKYMEALVAYHRYYGGKD